MICLRFVFSVYHGGISLCFLWIGLERCFWGEGFIFLMVVFTRIGVFWVAKIDKIDVFERLIFECSCKCFDLRLTVKTSEIAADHNCR